MEEVFDKRRPHPIGKKKGKKPLSNTPRQETANIFIFGSSSQSIAEINTIFAQILIQNGALPVKDGTTKSNGFPLSALKIIQSSETA